MSRVRNIGFVLMSVVALLPGSVAAQQAKERMYRESTSDTSVIGVPNGPVTVTSTHDATIRTTFFRPDSVHAFFTNLRITETSPRGAREPDVSSALNQPFVLKIDRRGHVETLSTPIFPESLKGITDLRYEFFDFFAPSPGSPLKAGLEWADTLVLQQNTGAMSGETRKIATLRVAGDTTVDGVAGWLIRGDGVITTGARGPVEGQPGISVQLNMEGPERNTYVVSKADNALILRIRSAELKGTMKYIGAPQAVQFDLARSYDNQIRRLVPAGK